ncbi:MAG TPA: LysE family transporter [Bacteroidales bacterium]
MKPLLQGILMGLTVTVSFGPGFIALFQTSIVRGVKAGIVLAIGILLSDLVLISISYFGLSSLIVKGNTVTLGIIAGSILILSGSYSVFRSPSVNLASQTKLPDLQSRLPILLMKGFLLNIANPFVLIFWIGIMGFAASNYGMHSYGFFIFFLGLLSTAFSSDLMKCYLSSFLKNRLSPKTITLVNKTIGAIFIAIGIFIICKVVLI